MPRTAGHLVALAAAGLLAGGCEIEQWRNADLQLEVTGAALHSTDLVKVCVEDVGARTVALGAGRVGYPGLPLEGALTVTVDVLAEGQDTGLDDDTGATEAVRLGRAGPVTFDGTALIEAAWQPCEGDCTPCRQAAIAVDEADNRLLAVRFIGLD